MAITINVANMMIREKTRHAAININAGFTLGIATTINLDTTYFSLSEKLRYPKNLEKIETQTMKNEKKERNKHYSFLYTTSFSLTCCTVFKPMLCPVSAR
jgi:hypothetical protein